MINVRNLNKFWNEIILCKLILQVIALPRNENSRYDVVPLGLVIIKIKSFYQNKVRSFTYTLKEKLTGRFVKILNIILGIT